MPRPAASRVPTPAELVAAERLIESHALAPDGTFLVYVLRRVVRGRYRRHLRRVDADGRRDRALTHGTVSDRGPAISPDGRFVAFIRSPVGGAHADEDRFRQAWLVPSSGGDAVQLTHMAHGVASVHWSPDGSRLGLVAGAPEARFIVGEERPGAEPTARRMTRADFRDDTGFRDRRAHLWRMSPRPGARPRRLTQGDFDVESPAWSPDGARIAFAADMTPDAALAPRTTLWSIPVDGGEAAALAELPGDISAPAWSPDGSRLACFGTAIPEPPESTQPELWIVDAATGATRSLSGTLDLPGGVWARSGLGRGEQPEGPFWLDDRTLVALFTRRGRALPYRFDLDGGIKPLLDPASRTNVRGLQVAGGRIVANAQVDGSAHDLASIEPRAHARLLTRQSEAWWRSVARYRLDEAWVPGPAGPIQTWVASPARAGSRALPTIIDIHGGPTGAWAPGGSLDLVALTDRGYRVVRPNIRGSASFGAAWAEGLGARWGDADAADVLAVTDWLVDRRLAVPGQVGVMGLSYGGFLVNWLVGVTDRYAAAVSENGVTNQVTAWAECYFGPYDTRRTGLGDPLGESGVTALWSRSPLRNVGSIRTPLLMLQAAEDRICPASDNVQLFLALRALGREVEYVLYPEEHHGMQTVGRPDRRIDRLERILAWFEERLG